MSTPFDQQVSCLWHNLEQTTHTHAKQTDLNKSEWSRCHEVFHINKFSASVNHLSPLTPGLAVSKATTARSPVAATRADGLSSDHVTSVTTSGQGALQEEVSGPDPPAAVSTSSRPAPGGTDDSLVMVRPEWETWNWLLCSSVEYIHACLMLDAWHAKYHKCDD